MKRTFSATIAMPIILALAANLQAQLPTCCDFQSASFPDYAPQSTPDFDQKQNQPAWSDGINPTHCGPVVVANCLWWLDSKFDGIFMPSLPPAISDGYPLVIPYGAWDDHDPQNVVPLVNDLAMRMQTNQIVKGTIFDSLISGTRDYIASRGLTASFNDTMVAYPSFDYIKSKVFETCNVILLLGFYEDDGACCRIGGHYVAVAGVCTTSTQICVSDPWFDAVEGEPPAGGSHGPTIHNDPSLISGPHGQSQHDPYTLSSVTAFCPGVTAEEMNFPFGAIERTNFLFQNRDEGAQCTPSGAAVKTVIEYAYVLCPDSTLVGIIDENIESLPDNYELRQNYPNPFNLSTIITFTLPARSRVEITIFNQLGQVVRLLLSSSKPAGTHEVVWNGQNDKGEVVASGVYLYTLETDRFKSGRKMLLLK